MKPFRRGACRGFKFYVTHPAIHWKLTGARPRAAPREKCKSTGRTRLRQKSFAPARSCDLAVVEMVLFPP